MMRREGYGKQVREGRKFTAGERLMSLSKGAIDQMMSNNLIFLYEI